MAEDRKNQKVMNPAKLGESIRASVEEMQAQGTYEEALKEALSSSQTLSYYERSLLSYIEYLTEEREEIVKETEDQAIVSVSELETTIREAQQK